MTFISVKGLRAGYGKSVVLRDVDLEVEEGEAVAVVGKNGAGKSTLLMSFFGGTTISGGSIEVGGVALQKLPAFRAATQGVTISPQGRMILPHLTVGENLLLGGASRRKGHWTPETVYRLFPVLHERRDKMGQQLSGGQQQMLAVGRGAPHDQVCHARPPLHRTCGANCEARSVGERTAVVKASFLDLNVPLPLPASPYRRS